MSARTWNVIGAVVGSKYLGKVTADTAAEALRKADDELDRHVSLCHQCSDECEDPEVAHIVVACGDETATDREEDDWQAKARAAGWTPPAPAPSLNLDANIAALGLSRRADNLLGGTAQILTVRALLRRTPSDLRKIRGFGAGCLREVEEALAAHGLRLAGAAS